MAHGEALQVVCDTQAVLVPPAAPQLPTVELMVKMVWQLQAVEMMVV